MTISRKALSLLQEAFTDELSTCMAADMAGVSYQTATCYRRLLEFTGAIDPSPLRKARDGRTIPIGNLGAHNKGAPRPMGVKRSQFAHVAGLV